MSVLEKIAINQGRRDEVPNRELAQELVAAKNVEGIAEIAAHLQDKDENVRSDCIKVLYEVGYIEPELIVPFAESFIKLLLSRNNRLVWGGMISLSTIASKVAPLLFEHRARIIKTMDEGSVITMDGGIKVLAAVAADNPQYEKELLPYLLEHLKKCRIKEVPQHAESTLVCINPTNKIEFVKVLEQRLPDMTASQASRIKKILKQLS